MAAGSGKERATPGDHGQGLATRLRFVLLDDRARYPPARGHVEPLALRPFPDRLVLLPVAARAAPAAAGGPRSGLGAPYLGGCLDVRLQPAAQLRGVLLGQVDLVVDAVDRELDSLLAATAVQIVDEMYLDFAGHGKALSNRLVRMIFNANDVTMHGARKYGPGKVFGIANRWAAGVTQRLSFNNQA